MLIQLESYVVDLIEGRKKSPFLCAILRAMSLIFKAGVNLRNFAFDRHLVKETKVDIPVLSVGNIIAGGTGKTALIQKLGRDLSSFCRISVLLRGYRSKIEKMGSRLDLRENSDFTSEVCGDEACLLKKQLPQTSLFVGKNRCLNAKRAAYRETDVILIDDGMQYRRLHRNLEIVILHADDLYGHGFYLPRGYLRDCPKRLAKADYIFINHVSDQDHFESLKKELKKKSKAPLIGVKMVPLAIKGEGEEQLEEDFKCRRIAVFCGLGKPKSFVSTLEEMGFEVVELLIVPDHTSPTRRQLIELALLSEEKGCEAILCSEKDWVKLPKNLNLSLPLAYLEASLEIVAQKEHYDQLLQDVKTLINRRTYETLD